MTIHPSRQQFEPLISGNVRTADLVNSIAKEIDRITEYTADGAVEWQHRARREMYRALVHKLQRLADTIEKGER
jgi:plasmid stabilization system protein ParE